MVVITTSGPCENYYYLETSSCGRQDKTLMNKIFINHIKMVYCVSKVHILNTDLSVLDARLSLMRMLQVISWNFAHKYKISRFEISILALNVKMQYL